MCYALLRMLRILLHLGMLSCGINGLNFIRLFLSFGSHVSVFVCMVWLDGGGLDTWVQGFILFC